MSSKGNVLIVDDSDIIRTLLRHCLTDIGYACAETGNGLSALDTLRNKPYDVALIDLSMPELNGMQLLGAMQREEIDVVPVILTADGEVSIVVEAMKLGAFDFLQKPPDLDLLHQTVEKAVQHHQLSRHARQMSSLAEQWEATFDASPDMIFITDLECRILRCNRATTDCLGANKDDLIGRFCYEALCKSECPPAFCPLDAALKNQSAYSTEVSHGPWNGFFQLTCVPLKKRSGDIWGWLHIARNITERKRAEETYMRLATAVEQAGEIITVTGTDGTIQYVNPAFERITGYGRDEAVGQNPRIRKSGKHDESFYRRLWETILSGQTWHGRFINRKKDGTIHHEDATISPVRDVAGNMVNFVSVARDVTQQVMLEQHLRQAQKLESIGQLAAGIAHEINTPTQYIGDNVRFLQNAFDDLLKFTQLHDRALEAAQTGALTPQMLKELQTAREKADVEYLLEDIPRAIQESLTGVKRVAEIVRAMKQFAHPDVDEKAPIDINEAITSTITVARNEWKYVSDVVTDFDPNLPPVPCFPGEFNQVILNLIVNAAHAISGVVKEGAGQKGTITVTTKLVRKPADGGVPDSEWAQIRVADTGTGIPEEIRHRIFDQFFTTKEVGKGTGLGLSLAHSVVVDKHGGALSFETETGRGTTFLVELPIHPPERERGRHEETNSIRG